MVCGELSRGLGLSQLRAKSRGVSRIECGNLASAAEALAWLSQFVRWFVIYFVILSLHVQRQIDVAHIPPVAMTQLWIPA